MVKTVKVKIDAIKENRHGEAEWRFELVKSGAFAYGNGTAVECYIKSVLDGQKIENYECFDTRYYKGIKSEQGFTDFCLDTVKDFYGRSATEVTIA